MSSSRRRSLARVAPAALLCVLAGACSSSESKTGKAAADSIMSALARDTLPPSARATASPPTSGPPTGKIRVANLAYLGGKPLGAIDLYEVNRPDSTAKPIITNLAFGQLSAYVTPRAPSSYPGSVSNLYMFPSGSRTVALPYGALEQSGFVQGDQVTVVLGPLPVGESGVTRFDVAEEGKRIVKERQDAQHAIPPGKALVLVRDADRLVTTAVPVHAVMIDGTCVPPSDEPRAMPGIEGTYPVSAGAHTLSVATSPNGKSILSCKGMSPGATTTLTVEAGRRYLALVYGQASDGLRVLTAPIDPP